MEKEFVPYELALRLKSLGFDEPCIYHWERGNDGHGWGLFTSGYYLTYKDLTPEYKDKDGNVCGEFSCPTFSQAFRWFREEHNIDGEVYLILVAHNGIDKEQQLSDKEYSFKVIINGIPEFISIEDIYSSYEEAELACLEKLLEIIEKK